MSLATSGNLGMLMLFNWLQCPQLCYKIAQLGRAKSSLSEASLTLTLNTVWLHFAIHGPDPAMLLAAT